MLDPNRITQLVNEERTKAGLPSVSLNVPLNRAALERAKDMVSNHYWSHVSKTGQYAWPFITNQGYKYEKAGENLARGFKDADEVVKGWVNSPTHKAQLLHPEYQHMGLAILPGGNGLKKSWYVVQLFGKPKPNPLTPKK